MSKASVHDAHDLSDIKHSQLSDCTLISDKRVSFQRAPAEMFSSCNIRLKISKKSNQKDKEPFTYAFKELIKRIKISFSQFCYQLMFKRYYVKINMGISICLLSKITAVTVLLHINQ